MAAEGLFGLTLTGLSLSVMSGQQGSGWGVVATIALFVAFLVRRHTLRLTFVLAAAGGVMQLVDPHGFIIFGDFLYAPICAEFGVHRDARVRRLGLAAAVAAAVTPAAVIMPQLILDAPAPPHWATALGLCVMFAGAAAIVSVGGWAWGYLRLQQRLRVESAIAAQLSDAERVRLEQTAAQSAFREQIAAEMHDVVGHSWAVVAAQADGARYAMRTSPEIAERALETIADVARTAITELRQILRQLRYSEGVEGQIGAEQQSALLDRMRSAGMTIDFAETGEPPASQQIRLTAYRALTESLTNALKHGDLRAPVHVRLEWNSGFTLDVENRVAACSRLPGSGLGIVGLRDRARSLGGDLVTTTDGGTWRVHVDVPDAGRARLETTGSAADTPVTPTHADPPSSKAMATEASSEARTADEPSVATTATRRPASPLTTTPTSEESS